MAANETKENEMIGELNAPLDCAVAEFRISKLETKMPLKIPNWDSAGDSRELLYFSNKREYEVMLRLQQDMLENDNYQSAINKRHIHELHKDHTDLRRHFIATNFFLKDCDEKRVTAQKKTQQQLAIQHELDKNIDRCLLTFGDLTEFRRTLKRTVHEMEPYERVLRAVVDKSAIYVSINDCMNRCDALMLAQVDIQRMQEFKLYEIEEMGNRMKVITSEAALKILGLKNNLTALERSYTDARNACLKWEKTLGCAKKVVDTHGLNKERALDGLYHIYELLCNHGRIEKSLVRLNVGTVLDFIKNETELLREVLDACNESKTGKQKETRCI